MVEQPSPERPIRRRILIALAVISACCAIFAEGGFWKPELLIMAGLGAICGITALFNFSRQSAWFAVAFCGVVMSCSAGIGGAIAHAVWYYTEAPPGALRLSFDALLDSAGASPADRQLLGQTVCLKGYGYPTGEIRAQIFLLTADGGPDDTRRSVGVLLPVGQEWEWDEGPIVVTGTLTINPEYKGGQLDPRFLLKDAEVRTSKTPLGVNARRRSSC